ncbi:MAG: hypothetical protein ACI8RZ_006187 [Myxococcota bacterium]|jgi:hypothetical protein
MIPPEQHPNLLTTLLPEALRRLHPTLRAVRSDAALHVGLSADIQTVLTRACDRAGAAKWKASSPRLPATVDDLLARMVPVGPGTALLELRFRGLDPDFPFVEVVATDFTVTPALLPALLTAASQTWPTIPLRWLGLWVASHAGWQPPGAGDMHLVVGALASLDCDPGPLTTTPADADSLPRVVSAYADFHTARPDLSPHVNALDAETLDDLIATGTAWDAWLDGAWAGLLAVEASPLLGGPGFVVIEEVLAPALRGQGLGAVLQRAGLANLPPTPGGLVWGTIHEDNLPSRKTAARVGRTEVDLRWLVPIS